MDKETQARRPRDLGGGGGEARGRELSAGSGSEPTNTSVLPGTVHVSPGG